MQYLQHFSFNIFLNPPVYHFFISGVPSLSQFYLTNKTPIMPNLKIAFACVLTACLLFSCNNNKSKPTTAQSENSAVQLDTVQVLPGDSLDMDEYCTDFINSVDQKFTVAAKKISVITAAKGLRVTINPSALVLEDGSPVNGKINVNIIELTNSNDLFRSNAATVSNGRLLASGGSYYIGMENNGQQVKIKNGQTLQVDFPVLSNNEMELFYGERDGMGSMNWQKAGKELTQEFEKISFNTKGDDEPVLVKPMFKSKYHLFNTLNAKVFFMDKMMTLKEMEKEFRKRGIDKIIDTVYYNWYGDDAVVYSYIAKMDGFRHGRQYRLISPDELCREKDSLDNAFAVYNQAVEERSKNDFTTQMKTYYAPAGIGNLGWINCDRFYKSKDNIDVELDIPITLNYSQIEYFVIFKSFNGLLNKKVQFTEETKVVLENLPIGESVTLVAFAKNKGIIYQAKENFIIGKSKRVPVEFKTITKEEVTKIFRNNVRA
jgi:hypothetical protein